MHKILRYLASIPHDKLLHSFYGILIYVVASLVNPMFGILAVIVAAVAKELYDEFIYGGFDWKDIIATVGIPLLLFIKDVYGS